MQNDEEVTSPTTSPEPAPRRLGLCFHREHCGVLPGEACWARGMVRPRRRP